jgi:co-chaperonin GroES (HSP10)
MTPLRDRIIVKPQRRELSKILEVVNNEPFNRGTVVSVGPQVTGVTPGDFILYGNGDYLKWPLHKTDAGEVQVIQEADVCAVVEE